MTTSIEVRRGGSWEAIQYSDFKIELGVSEVKVAPTATVTTHVNESLSAGQDARIVIDSAVRFQGWTNSPGTARENGQVNVALDHPASELWETQCDVDLTSPTDEEVLQQALTNANTEESYTLNYVGSATNLDNDYSVENRAVKSIWRDMVDRTDRVWWCNPANTTITVAPRGNGGQWNALDAQADRISVQSFDEGSVDTVVNDVTVIGTGDVKVEGNATDSTSISTYGRRSQTYNLSYVTTPAEADGVALSLLQADPIPEGRVAVGTNVGTIDAPLVNQTIDLTDSGKNINATGLVIERQVIEQGRATLHVGGGTAASVAEHNRQAKSAGDVTEPGSVYGNARLADDSVDTDQLVDTAVIEAKLADAAVATAKLQNNAVINGKLDDLSVSETKIQDDSISTPKIIAEAVTANEIEADTITAAEIAAGTITALEIAADTITAQEIVAGTITALEIAAGTLTANEVDVLDLDAQQISVGGVGNSMNFIAEQNTTPEPDQLSIAPDGQVTGQETILGFVNTTEHPDQHWDAAAISLIEPPTDQTGQVGSTTRAYDAMYAGAFNTSSPDEIAEVDRDEVRNADWYDNPPSPVVDEQRRQAGSEGARQAAIDPSDAPVELGTVANWLLEVCKDQQQQLDDLRDRVEQLEQQA